MLKEFVKHVTQQTGLDEGAARSALGIVLNAADRQGAEIAEIVFRKAPGARTLSAKAGANVGAATGLIARLIERTPGGRSAVAYQMIRDLQQAGLGHDQIASVFPAIAEFAQQRLGYKSAGHMGDLLGAGRAMDEVQVA